MDIILNMIQNHFVVTKDMMMEILFILSLNSMTFMILFKKKTSKIIRKMNQDYFMIIYELIRKFNFTRYCQ